MDPNMKVLGIKFNNTIVWYLLGHVYWQLKLSEHLIAKKVLLGFLINNILLRSKIMPRKNIFLAIWWFLQIKAKLKEQVLFYGSKITDEQCVYMIDCFS